MRKIFIFVSIIAVLVLGTAAVYALKPSAIRGERSVEDVVAAYEADVLGRLSGAAIIKDKKYPEKLLIYADKNTQMLFAYGMSDGKFQLIKAYKFTAMSGRAGPKLKEGDRQIPEGIYRLESFNPNSRYHLSLRVSYPGKIDREMAKRDGRDMKKLGGDIMIHGKAATIGCIPIGDPAIEELFVIAAKTGKENVEILISPQNLLKDENVSAPGKQPAWYPELCTKIKARMQEYEKLGVAFF